MRFVAIMNWDIGAIWLLLAGQVLDRLIRQRIIGVVDWSFVVRVSQHAFFLAVGAVSLLQTLLYILCCCALIIYMSGDAKVGASSIVNNSSRALVGPACLIYLLNGCQALPLAVNTHILGAVRRWFTVRYGDRIYFWLTCAHGAAIDICSIALILSLL